MSAWPMMPLGEIVSLKGGGTPRKDVPEYWDGSIPWATVKDFKSTSLSGTQDSISASGLTASAANLIPAGHVIIPTRMALGKAAINDIDVAINQDLRALLPAKPLDTRYLLHAMLSLADDIERQGSGATVKGITQSRLLALKIPLPPLPEQKRIAKILDAAAALRAKRRESLAQLDALLQSTFLEMFGDPVENLKGWNATTTLGEIADLVSGITKGRKVKGQQLREIPYLAVANVQDRHLSLDNVKTIEATEAEISRYRLLKGDLLLTEGGDPDKLGRGSLWSGELEECIHQNHVFRVRLHSERVRPIYLNWLIGSARGKRYFMRSAKQTTGIASINMTQLRAFPMLIPPVEIQDQFSTAVTQLEEHRLKLTKQCKELDILFSSLQHSAFTGQL
ncbi:MAG: hypothetical protein Tsb0027_17840 [Wenzhouxiangellaceae bacterium]